LEQVLESRSDLARILLIASDTKESLADISIRLDRVAEGIDVLTIAEGTRKSEQITKENQKKITDKLLGSTDVAQKSTTTCNDCWVSSMKNSGEWLNSLPEYEAWLAKKPDANPLLLVTGDPNTGKSFLSSVIVHQLQSSRGRATQTPTRTPLVAYHFFPKKTEKSTQDPRPAETALKCLAVQIADRDPAYAKKLLALCESTAWADGMRFKDLSCKELWQSLNFIVPKRDLTYFIILDGLDQLPGENSEQLLNILSGLNTSLPDADRNQLRVLATGTWNTFPKEQFADVLRINIPECNIEEIARYIDHQLKEKDLLQGKDPETIKLRDSISDKIPKLVDGDFFKVRTIIVKINDLVASDGSATEVESILKEAGQSREEIARDVVNAANQILGAKEIDEVNEMLVWAIFGQEYFGLVYMQAALVRQLF
jgi:Cdc6-like AAA superfamily ATPase